MDVSRSFGARTVLSNVVVELNPGEIHGLIGPNGVGKTTLLRIMAGLTEPSDGTVQVLGGAPTTDAVRSRIGWIPGGDRTFYLRLSGIDNLIFFGRMYGLTKTAAKIRGREILTKVGLSAAAERPTGIYSKGMLKRLAVARALVPHPSVLLCDETTHDLDPEGSSAIRALVAGLAAEGMTVVWATQRLDELASFAQSVTVLSEGGVAYTGRFDEFVSRFPSRKFEIRFGAEMTTSASRVLDDHGVRHHRTEHRDGLIVEIDERMPIGELVAALTRSGFIAASINELGSHVEAAYYQVLGSSQP